MGKRNYVIILLVALLLSACASTKKIAYFRDLNKYETDEITNQYTNVIKTGDMLSIAVSSTKPELAVPYNPYTVRNQISSMEGVTSAVRPMEGYVVDLDGNIDFPQLGKLHIEGLTREQIVDMVKDKLAEYVPDPIVTVSFMNFTITVIGEVARAGSFNVQRDRVSVLEALGLAGDMTLYGDRRNVLVIRENAGVRSMGRINLQSKTLFDSEFFYLQQNDVVVVDPINAKANSISPFMTNLPVAVSLTSFVTSIVMLIINFK